MNKDKIILVLKNLNPKDAEIQLGDLIVELKGFLLSENADNMSPEKIIQELIEIRQVARESGQYEFADSIRERLLRCNIVLKDRSDLTTWQVKEKHNEN